MKKLIAIAMAVVLLLVAIPTGGVALAGGDNPIAYWTAEGNADDASGNGNHGVMNGATIAVQASR
ncbi:hypothetical protein ACFLVM_03470 [Chloroflexota bacterium]